MKAVRLLILAVLAAAAGSGAEKNGVSWGDLGDGRYRNPILKSDYSDPDVIRVGNDYYLVASDFHFMGIQVLHSKDLVNWEIVGQVFHRLDISPKYDEMRAYGEGTWAPSLRFHDGEFYLYVCTPYDGLFLWHTKDPGKLWTGPVTVKAISGWEDPCPFWDDDGQAYLLRSKKGAGPLILHKMSADGTQLLDEGTTVYTGPTAEGPKLFKRNGYYYISHPEGGVGPGWQAVERSRTLYGPYEHRVVLSGGVHQGGMVDTPGGEWWFLGFKSTGWLGRIGYLEPVRWGADDWPVFGDEGKPVDEWKKPAAAVRQAASRPPTSDEFSGDRLSAIWQWNHNPVDESWSLRRKGYLRLTALPAADVAHARNTLTEKLWDEFGTIETRIELAGLGESQQAGLAFLSGPAFRWVAAERSGGGCRGVWPDGQPVALKDCGTIWFRGVYRRGEAALLYSADGRSWSDTGQKITLQFASWKGARFGVFSFGPAAGFADVDYVHYDYGSTEGSK